MSGLEADARELAEMTRWRGSKATRSTGFRPADPEPVGAARISRPARGEQSTDLARQVRPDEEIELRTIQISLSFPSAQRTAVKQRPHQETERSQVATTEPVVLHHGREGGGTDHDDVRPTASTACWAALTQRKVVALELQR